LKRILCLSLATHGQYEYTKEERESY